MSTPDNANYPELDPKMLDAMARAVAALIGEIHARALAAALLKEKGIKVASDPVQQVIEIAWTAKGLIDEHS